MIRTGRQKTTCVYLCNELVFCLWSNWDLISLQTFGPVRKNRRWRSNWYLSEDMKKK